MQGEIRIAKVVNPGNSVNGYRCEILALDTNSKYFAICNPSPYGAMLPEANALVYFLDAPYSKRIVGVLHDLDYSRTIAEISAIGEEALNAQGDTLEMVPGDCYIGKYGRAFFAATGDVDITTSNVRAELFLDQDTGCASLSGNDFSVITKDDGVKIYTKSSTGVGFGDTLCIERNLADGIVKATDLVIDELGNYDLNVGYVSGDPTLSMALAVTGEYSVANQSGGCSLLASGIWEMFSGGQSFSGSSVGMEMDNIAGTLELKAEVIDLTGDASISGDLAVGGKIGFHGIPSIGGPALPMVFTGMMPIDFNGIQVLVPFI